MANVKHRALSGDELHIPKTHLAASHSDQDATGVEVDDAVSKKHARKHGLNSEDDHSGMAGTVGNLVKIAAEGYLADSGVPSPAGGVCDYYCLSIPYGRSPDVDEIIFNGHYFLDDVTIVKIGIHGTKPSSNLTVDLLKDDVEQTRVATLSAGASDEETDITDIDYVTTKKLGLKVTAIGSPEPGEIYSLVIFYKKKAA